MREGSPAQALKQSIQGRIGKHRSPDMPSGPLSDRGDRPGRGRREVNLGAALDQRGCEVIPDGQDAIAKSIVEAEFKRASKMLARAPRELALDPKDADVRAAAPVAGGCKVVEIAQD